MGTGEYCRICGRELTLDEIGATKKLVNRGSTVFYCLDCLADYFNVPRAELEKKIEHFRNMGCTLFSPADHCEKGEDYGTVKLFQKRY